MNSHLKLKNRSMPMRFRTSVALLAVLVSTAACDLDFVNPNAPIEEEVLTTPDGIIALGVAIQGQAADAVRNYVLPSALVTDVWGPKSRALAADKALFAGTPDRSFLIVREPYQETYEITRSANNLIESAPQVGLGTGLETGIVALAKLHKAMALGQAIQIYEQVPVDTSLVAAELQPRDVVLDTVLSLLESAQADLAGVADADLDVFRSRVLDPGTDLRNTIHAMLARYYLIDGQYQQAIDAAGAVDLSVESYYSYTGAAQNPIYQYAIALDYVAPLESFAEDAEAGDQRVDFWTDPSVRDTIVDPVLIGLDQYSDRSDPYPLYLPDEMRLIQAEAYAWMGELEMARELINEVRTDCEPGLVDPAACLPTLTEGDLPTQGAVLAQVAYERRYELYEMGLRWEDLRRLGPYVDAAPKVDFLPIPQRECEVNPAAGC